MTTARWYISGPMTGLPELNYPAFHSMASRLRAAGFEVENPAEINASETDRAVCMKRDIERLLTCDAVLLLPGWEASRGALLEVQIAKELRLPLVELQPRREAV